MPAAATIEAFVAMVTAGRFLEAMERFYAQDATAQENNAPPRLGLSALLANERRVLASNASVRAECLSPPMIAGDHAALHWRFTFHAASGATTVLEEIALQHWRGERLQSERFFYDPAQLRTPAEVGEKPNSKADRA